MSYKIILDGLRASEKEGKRYAKVRAIANGPDSYNSVFTDNARKSLISQLRANGVQSNALHKNAITNNIKKYLTSRYDKAYGQEKEDLSQLIGNLPNMDYPIGKVVDAYFVDDNTVEAIIEENYELKHMGAEQAGFLESTWNMISDGILSGVSIVFNDIKTMMSGDKMIIDDLNVRGLDFVSSPSHPETRVIDTFMRAMQDTTHIQDEEEVDDQSELEETRASETTKMTNEEVKPKVDPVVDVDDIVDKAAQKLEEKAKLEAEAKEAQSKVESEFEEKLKAKEEEIAKLAAERAEYEKVAEEAIKAAEEAKSTTLENPFAQSAQEDAEKRKDPLDGLSIRELLAIKHQNL